MNRRHGREHGQTFAHGTTPPCEEDHSMDDPSLVSPCLKAFVWTDHDGRASKWPYLVG